jgi:5-azacytidine-induced protein 1
LLKHRTLLDDKLDEQARRHQNELKTEKERLKLE